LSARWGVVDSDEDIRTKSLSKDDLVVEAEIVCDAGTCIEDLRDLRIAIGSIGARELGSACAAVESEIGLADATCLIVG